MVTLCYDCGNPVSDETREHIPAQCFYAGYSNDYKKNRITVPACRTCNENYSKIDQHFRDAIGVKNDNNADAAELTRKSVSSILRSSNWQDKLVIINGKVKVVAFDYVDIEKIQVKNFKGIFFSEFGFPLPQNFEVNVIIEGEKEEANSKELISGVMAVLMKDQNWKVSGNEKIFKYIIKSLDQETDKSITIKDTKFFAAVMDYHESISCLIIAQKNNAANSDSYVIGR